MSHFDRTNRIPTLNITNGRVGRIKVESAKPSVPWSIKRTIDENLSSITTLLAMGMAIAVTAAIKNR